MIAAEQLVLSGHSIVGITLSFSEAMNPDRAQDLSNYGYYLIAAGPSGVFGSSADSYASLDSATYSALTQSVTLTPSSPLPPNRFYRITIDGLASPLLHNGLTDLAGNQLAGSSGSPGTPEVVTFGVGGKLDYIDSGRNMVTLQLAKGGVIEMFRTPEGARFGAFTDRHGTRQEHAFGHGEANARWHRTNHVAGDFRRGGNPDQAQIAAV